MKPLPQPRRRPAIAGIGMALGLASALLAWPQAAPAQVDAAQATARLKPAKGLEATLFASEPMVINPTNIDVDSRGRVWVAEGLNYRMTHSKAFPKVEGADRIKILEDTDGDGKADKVTVFADNIYPIPMGLAVEERYGKDGKYLGARVYVGNSPDLLVLEDTDGDDRADRRSALLTGFGGVDSDHGVHGMTLGLDGKLYFTHGDGCCSFEAKDNSHNPRNFDVTDRSGRHVSSSNLANTLRVNRDGTEFEILADRQRNNYETALNAPGNAFTSDNDDDGNRGCRVIWVMDGGSYGYRTPGSPRHWGEEVPGNVPKIVGTGNGSPCGLAVYEGSLLGPSYKGAVLEADAGTRQINFLPIERHDSAFRTTYQVMLASDDPYFRPVDVAAAPDGSVLVADWYDAGVGGHSFRDQDTGRIYRVAPAGHRASVAKPDFATVPGLIAGLRSPVVAHQDAARRSLIERGAEPEARAALAGLFAKGDPIERARALWVRHAIEGDAVAIAALKDADPSIREQAVRILGRDLSRVGTVVFTDPKAKKPFAAQAHLKDLLPVAADPDAGVRRELILALRWLPTAEVGPALKALTRAWDGQDRFYLEALGLALQERETPFLADLFDGTLFGDLDLDQAGQDGQVALPPYFPADRNEAYIAAGTPDGRSTPLSRTLGLAWRIHRPETLPLLTRVLPSLAAPELQQAADDVLVQCNDKGVAVVLAETANAATDPARKAALMATLGRKLNGPWRDARSAGPVIRLIETTLADPKLRGPAIGLAVASFDGRYGPALMAFARDPGAPEDIRVAAVEGVGRIRPPKTAEFLDGLIAGAKEKGGSTPLAQAAVRTLPEVRPGANADLLALIAGADYPLGLRREALRAYSRPRNGGGGRALELARNGKLPEELRSEATAIVSNDADGKVRREGAELLPAPKAASGRTLPPIAELARRDGDPGRGRLVFHRASGANACAGCHRVQGEGRWVGPDLSTIGVKYGKDELFRSILYPSAAIGYNDKAHVLALSDGRVLTGLVVEESPERITLKLADGRRESVRAADVEDHKISEVSLMPEGLAATMTDAEFVDLVAYLATLRLPVSIVGRFGAVGPVAPLEGPIDPKAGPVASGSKKLNWRRLDANAEGYADLSLIAGDDPARVAYLHAPVLASADGRARLVLDTGAEVKAWLDGKELALPPAAADTPRSVDVNLTRGDHDLILRVSGGPKPGIVATFVAPRPLEFRAPDAAR